MAIINGTSGNDDNALGGKSIVGKSENDIIHGLEGNDNISGNGGSHDELFGDGGNDFIDASNGGNHLLDGGGDNDQLFGGDGSDTLIGGTGNDIMQGGSGNDSYNVDSSSDSVVEFANGGNDTVLSSVSFTLPDTVENLTLIGTANIEAVSLAGGSGNNLIDASQFTLGKVFLFGGDGDDTLRGGAGSDTINGGAGVDVLQVQNNFNLTINSTRMAGNGIDTFKNIERIEATGGDANNIFNASTTNVLVTLNGGDGNDTLTGGAKSDILDGGNGDDKLAGGGGNNTLTGNAGSDRFIFNTGNPFQAITSGFSNITDFTSGSDKIVLDKTTFTSLQSGVGNGLKANDFAIVTSGSNRGTAVTESNARIIYHTPTGSLIYNENGSAAGVGAAGGDVAALKNSPTLTTSDFVAQSGSTDGLTGIPTKQLASNVVSFNGLAVGGIVKGNSLSNTIHTGGGDDIAMGGGGNDKIHGGAGNDIISGDQGKDTLFGAAGWDTFVLAPNAGVDVIRGFQDGVDHLGLQQLQFEQLQFKQQGSSTVISTRNRDLAILDNTQANQLTADDFVNVTFDKVNGVRVPVAAWL